MLRIFPIQTDHSTYKIKTLHTNRFKPSKFGQIRFHAEKLNLTLEKIMIPNMKQLRDKLMRKYFSPTKTIESLFCIHLS